MGRLYYETYRNPVTDDFQLIQISYMEETKGEFEKFLSGLDIIRELQLTDANGFDVSKYWEDGKEVWVWNVDEDWKHNIVDRLASTIGIDYIDLMLSGIGIRNVFNLVNESGMFEDMTMNDLSTDLGMRKLFYGILDYHLECLEDDRDGRKEITEEEWNMWEERNNLSDNDDDETEEDFDEIVPITDEALDSIGGKVAMCA